MNHKTARHNYYKNDNSKNLILNFYKSNFYKDENSVETFHGNRNKDFEETQEGIQRKC
jgi:hypothetical protein